jgi:hypothetical protein
MQFPKRLINSLAISFSVIRRDYDVGIPDFKSGDAWFEKRPELRAIRFLRGFLHCNNIW